MSHVTQPHDASETGLRPPKFSLRTLLLTMGGLCCLFAVMSAVGMLWSAALLMLLGLVLAHVLGNSLGTKLRDQATRQVAQDRARRPPAATVRANVVAPRRLAERARLNRVTPVMSIGGALVLGELGGVGLATVHPQASPAAVALGVISSAVLGAFAGFLASSFLSVVRQALAEAHRGAAPTVRHPISGKPR